MKINYDELGRQVTSLLDSLAPGEIISIWRAGLHDEAERPGSWGAQLLTHDEALDDDVPAFRNGVECYSAGQRCWQDALDRAGLTATEENSGEGGR